VIFLVGLVSIIVINNIYDMNVFKEYNNAISLLYYMFMVGFSWVVSELPKISFNVFDIKLFRCVVKTICEGYRKSGLSSYEGKMLLDDSIDGTNLNSVVPESILVLKEKDGKVTSGREKRFKSAGIRGLYGDPNNRGVVYNNDTNDINNPINTKLSTVNKVKSRLV
jgi:hypothetical protein